MPYHDFWPSDLDLGVWPTLKKKVIMDHDFLIRGVTYCCYLHMVAAGELCCLLWQLWFTLLCCASKVLGMATPDLYIVLHPGRVISAPPMFGLRLGYSSNIQLENDMFPPFLTSRKTFTIILMIIQCLFALHNAILQSLLVFLKFTKHFPHYPLRIFGHAYRYMTACVLSVLCRQQIVRSFML